MSKDEWRKFTSMFVDKAERSLDDFFHETVNLLSLQNIRVYRFDELIAYHLSRLDNAFFLGSLYNSLDIQITPAKNSPIYFARSYPARASKRVYSLNSMCVGWTDSLNIKLKYFPDFDVLKLSWNGNEVEVGFKLTETLYFSDDFLIDFNEKKDTALIYFKNLDFAYHYDTKKNCIYEIQASDGRIYEVTCNLNGFVQEITSSQSRFSVKFTYSIRNCLKSINKPERGRHW